MRLTLQETPRLVTTRRTPAWVHIRVISGDARVSVDSADLYPNSGGGGLPLAVADGLVSLVWPVQEIWVSCPPGGAGEIEIVV